MRLLKRILKILAVGFALAITLLVLLPWLPVAVDGLKSKKQTQYLAANSTTLNLSNAEPGFSFDEDFYANRLFLLGEMHGFSRVQDLDLALLTHLNARLGIRHYMAEIDPATAIIFNDALRTGDDSTMMSVFEIWHDERQSQWGNLDFLAKIRAIRDLNETLPDTQRIYFIGVDGPPKAEFVALASTVSAPEGSPIYDLNTALLSASQSRKDGTGRYSHILGNIALMEEALPNLKFYGLWGVAHINKIGTNGNKSLSYYLNTGTETITPTFADKVATVATLCVGTCSNMMPSGSLPGIPQPTKGEFYTEIPMRFDNTYLFRTRGIGAAKAIMKDAPNMLFDMNNSGSPYLSGKALVASTGYMSMMQNFKIDGAAGENFDALILMNGSRALRPLKGEAFVFTQ